MSAGAKLEDWKQAAWKWAACQSGRKRKWNKEKQGDRFLTEETMFAHVMTAERSSLTTTQLGSPDNFTKAHNIMSVKSSETIIN